MRKLWKNCSIKNWVLKAVGTTPWMIFLIIKGGKYVVNAILFGIGQRPFCFSMHPKTFTCCRTKRRLGLFQPCVSYTPISRERDTFSAREVFLQNGTFPNFFHCTHPLREHLTVKSTDGIKQSLHRN